MTLAAQRFRSFVFAGGGTGGHLFPMLSLAREIKHREPSAQFVFCTTSRPIDERVIRREFHDIEVRIVAQPIEPLPKSLGAALRFARAWRASMKLCHALMQSQAPAVVIGSGGFGSAPAICAAAKYGIPTALLNPDAIPGKANRFLAARADVVVVQWPLTERQFPRSARVLALGCPIRHAFSNVTREAGIQRFNLDPAKKTLLVTGASQGADSINRAFERMAVDLATFSDWQILHLTGRSASPSLANAYESNGVHARMIEFTEHMPEAMAAADLMVTRAGASTLAEITAVGIPSVIMPYPFHRDRHQYINASMLTEAGAGVLVEDGVKPEKNAPGLSAALTRLMSDENALASMAERAIDISQPVACQNITDLLFALALGERGGGLRRIKPLRPTGDCSENRRRDEDKKDGAVSIDAAA